MVKMSKKILRLWLWWAVQQQQQQQQQRGSLALMPLKEGFRDQSPENSRLAGGRYFRLCNVKEVPKGFLAVYVGPELRRFVIPTSYLSMPDFKALMEQMVDEFGFEQEGGLQIPCEEKDFEEILGKCKIKIKTRKK